MRILVIRLSALGDIMMASGLVPALRSLHPQARLAWLVEPPGVPLLAANPRIDELFVWPRAEWSALRREGRYRELWRRFRDFRARIAAARFDLVLDAQGLLKSGLWAWWSRAPRRIGLGSREGSRWLMTETLTPPVRGGDILGAEYRHLARHLGAAPEAFRLDLAVGEPARERARAALAQAGVQGRYAVLCPFTTRPQKHWFEDRWAALAARLAAAGLRPVLLGGPADREAAARIAAASATIADLAGRLALDASIATIAEAALLVGVDTGLTHAGSAFAIPTVALFGSTRPYVHAGMPGTRVLFEEMACAPCRRHPTCGGRFDCMRALQADAVADTALALAGPHR